MQAKPHSEASSGSTVSLRVLLPFLGLFGALLYNAVGFPHSPNPPLQFPEPTSLEALLRSSRPPLDGLIYVVDMVGWAIWGWLVLSVVLQLLAGVAERVAAGSAAVRALRVIADVLSAPLIRKAVQASLASGIMVRVALAGAPAAAAAPPPRPAFITDIGSQTGL